MGFSTRISPGAPGPHSPLDTGFALLVAVCAAALAIGFAGLVQARPERIAPPTGACITLDNYLAGQHCQPTGRADTYLRACSRVAGTDLAGDCLVDGAVAFSRPRH